MPSPVPALKAGLEKAAACSGSETGIGTCFPPERRILFFRPPSQYIGYLYGGWEEAVQAAKDHVYFFQAGCTPVYSATGFQGGLFLECIL